MMDIKETVVPQAGVFRCCLASVAFELEEVNIGDKTKCEYCNEDFMLTEDKTWVPLWQIKEE